MAQNAVDTQQLQTSKVSTVENEVLSNFQKAAVKIIEKVLEKLESIQEKLEKRKRELDVTEEQNIPPANPSKFVIRNVFKSISKMEKSKNYSSEDEEHFGVLWSLLVCRKENRFDTYLGCKKSDDIGKWSIDTEFDLRIINPNGKSATRNFEYVFDKCIGRGNAEMIKWEDMMKEYSVDDKLIVEAHVTINKMTGIYKENLRSFDETMRDVSDVVLLVKKEKFHVSKLYLATHSSYFKTLFLGGFNESTQSEIILSGIDYYDFQNYLEVLYGENAIDEVTVEGILLLGDMYDTLIVVRKCEEFLLKEPKKTLKKKLQMSIRYNLEKLKKKCLSEIKTAEEIRSVIPGDINDLDPSIMAVLLEKSLSLK